MKLRIAAVAGVGLLGAVAVALPGVAGGNKYAASSVSFDCGDGDTVALFGPLKLWPPNHKFVDEPVTATDADGSGPITLALFPTLTDASGGDGGSNHDPDWNSTTEDGESFVATGDGVAVAGFQLRAERSGKGDGRLYTVDWTATFDDKECSSSESDSDALTPFLIEVPHDMRGGADWKK